MKWEEYEEIASSLLDWLQQATELMLDKNFPATYNELRVCVCHYHHWMAMADDDFDSVYCHLKQKKVKVTHTRLPSEHRVSKLIPVLGSQPAGDVNHKPDGRLPLLSARPALTPATLKRAATSFAAW